MRGICKAFGGLRALIDVDLDLYDAEVLAIVGDNGAGKSTLISHNIEHVFSIADWVRRR